MKKSKPATIKDIARKLGISISTVSRALRQMPEVNPETRKAVMDLAEKLDYQPNQVALSLVTRQTHCIGVLVPNLDYFFASAVRGIDEMALSAGFTVMTCQSNESYGREIVNTQRLASNRVDGLIVSLSSETNNVDHFVRLLNRNVPIVFFDRVDGSIDGTKVILDNYDGAVQAVSHLVEQGCRRIMYLAGPQNLSISREREGGYLDTLRAHQIPLDSALIVHCEFDQEHAYHAVLERFRWLEPRPDAVFAVSDRMAIGALRALKELGLRVPEDVALVGFNDDPIMNLLSPPVTSVAQPAFEMGRIAAQVFIEQINSEKPTPPRTILLKPQLVIRHSSLKKGASQGNQ